MTLCSIVVTTRDYYLLSCKQHNSSLRSHIDNLSIYRFLILRHKCLPNFYSLLNNQNHNHPQIPALFHNKAGLIQYNKKTKNQNLKLCDFREIRTLSPQLRRQLLHPLSYEIMSSSFL